MQLLIACSNAPAETPQTLTQAAAAAAAAAPPLKPEAIVPAATHPTQTLPAP